MSIRSKVFEILPYVVLLAFATFLYGVAQRFVYTPIPGQIGPDFWPRMIIVLLSVCCVFEIGRRLAFSSAATPAPAAVPDEDYEAEVAPLDLDHEQTHPWFVIAAIAASVLYLAALEWTGFFVATVVYVSVLIWLGGVRRLAVLVPSGFAITLFFLFVFSKVIYVSLPIGRGDFERISLTILKLLGVH